MTLEPSAVEALKSLVLGFAFAGLLASAFELFTQRRAGFELLQGGGVGAVASVPVVVFSAPFLILRNTVRGKRLFQNRFNVRQPQAQAELRAEVAAELAAHQHADARPIELLLVVARVGKRLVGRFHGWLAKQLLVRDPVV